MLRVFVRHALPLLVVYCLLNQAICAQAPTNQRLAQVIKQLTAVEFDGRVTNTDGSREAATYLAGLFRESGLNTDVRMGAKSAGLRSSYSQLIPGVGLNLVGMIEGKDAARKDEFIIIGAHYDALGGQFAGAMDNAAGVAVMLEVARLLAKNPPARSLLFIAFDSGEQNHAGAKFFVEQPPVPLERIAATVMLNGFGGGMSERLYDTLYVIGTEFSRQLHSAVSKHKRGAGHLALLGSDAMRFPGGEHLNFTLGQTPTITITNGVHYAYHSKADTPNRVNYAALEKHVAALSKVITEIADTPGKIEKQSLPTYDADEAGEWVRVLSSLRENVIKTPANNAGQAQLDDILLELKRHQSRPVQEPKAREAVILRAASAAFYIANPNAVEYNTLLNQARNHDRRGDKAQAIAAYQKLLKFITEEYRRDEQTTNEIRQRLARLGGK
jgi:hypothetical protein